VSARLFSYFLLFDASHAGIPWAREVSVDKIAGSRWQKTVYFTTVIRYQLTVLGLKRMNGPQMNNF
jgi:hypothetical protein